MQQKLSEENPYERVPTDENSKESSKKQLKKHFNLKKLLQTNGTTEETIKSDLFAGITFH